MAKIFQYHLYLPGIFSCHPDHLLVPGSESLKTKIPLGISSKRDLMCSGRESNYICISISYASYKRNYKRQIRFLEKYAFIDHPVSQKAVLREIGCSRWLSQMKQRFFQDVSPHLHEQPLRHLLLPWQSLHFLSIPEDYVPC